jgi:hypothetical protein
MQLKLGRLLAAGLFNPPQQKERKMKYTFSIAGIWHDEIRDTKAEAMADHIDYLKDRMDQAGMEVEQGDYQDAIDHLNDGDELGVIEVPDGTTRNENGDLIYPAA